MASEYCPQGDQQRSRYEHELNCLFGSEVKTKAQHCNLATIHLDDQTLSRIHATVESLLRAEDYPEHQRSIVNAMSDYDRTVLYLWVTDFNVYALHNEL